MTIEQVKGALFGVAIGDALGVPAKFKPRSLMELNPVADFEGFKTHNQPPGTFSDDINTCPPEKIISSGYVLHTLFASVWSFMTTDNYKDAVLKAVNLGNDTDTAGAITGGLAGLYYGIGNIPEKWKNEIAGTADIDELSQRLFNMRSKN